MTPVQQFNRQLAAAQLLSPDTTVVVAVSTGVDSMVLLALLQRLPLSQRPRLVVAHVDHHLRKQSATEADFLRQYCRDHQLIFEQADWLVASHPQTGIEAAGRAFRYQFFAQVMTTYHAAAVLTAHHANDQVETYLMKLTRGGDLTQLTGIAASRSFSGGQLVRPLLSWSKVQLRAYARAHQVPFYEDVTNQDTRLTRNRIRQRVVPELTALNPQLLNHVADYQQQLRDLLAAKQAMVQHLLPTVQTANGQLMISDWQRLPATWQRPVLAGWLAEKTTLPISELKLAPLQHWVNNAARPSGQFRLNANVELLKSAGIIDVDSNKKRVKKLMLAEKTMVDLNQWQKITATQTVGVFTTDLGVQGQPFRLSASDWPLAWRPWQPQDRVALKGGGHQTVRRALINAKVPATERAGVWVLVNAQGTVLWVVGHRFSYRDRDTGTQTVVLASKHTELKGVHLKR